jgi:hypothetical protein
MGTISLVKKIGKFNPPTNVPKSIEKRRHVTDTGGARNAVCAPSSGASRNGNHHIYMNIIENFMDLIF